MPYNIYKPYTIKIEIDNDNDDDVHMPQSTVWNSLLF